jgi:hypothetical protein
MATPLRQRSRQGELFGRSTKSTISIDENHRLEMMTHEIDWTELLEVVQWLRTACRPGIQPQQARPWPGGKEGDRAGGIIRNAPSSEVTQPLIEPRTLHHLVDGQPGRLAERHVSDAERLDLGQVRPRAEASVVDDLLRQVVEDLDGTLRELDRHGGVGRVTALDQAVDDQTRGTCGKKHLVAISSLAPVLANDGCLQKRHHR